ncbi:MAG: type I restriction endonuclease subunit S, partial [Symploca sp. SIO3C6]|nr:type I restriction endonuclease subunit S [Symploca sp. SIO3C6]
MSGVSHSGPAFNFSEIRQLATVKKGFTHFADGDVLMAKITPSMENGKAAIACNLVNSLGCGSTELHVIRPESEILPTFVYHYIHQESFRKEATKNMTGTAGQLRVPASYIKTTEMALPPLDEQRRIVAKLEKLLAKCEASKQRLDKIPHLLKRFRQSILAAACSGHLTADWRTQHPNTEPAS